LAGARAEAAGRGETLRKRPPYQALLRPAFLGTFPPVCSGALRLSALHS
jgi:hypothetical protein